jgi:hypothetical protein
MEMYDFQVSGYSRLVLLGMMLSTTSSVFFYMITAYMPTFGSAVLHLSSRAA